MNTRSPDEIAAYIARRIGYVCHRPRMYGGNGKGVDLLLYTYHEVWASVFDRFDDFRKTVWQVAEEEDCGSANFPTRYSMNHPDADEEEIAQYVVAQWKKISKRLGVAVPYAEIEAESNEPPDLTLGGIHDD